jgi:endo-alpha-1,4-polygalactosaminidase (GH114 family)
MHSGKSQKAVKIRFLKRLWRLIMVDKIKELLDRGYGVYIGYNNGYYVSIEKQTDVDAFDEYETQAFPEIEEAVDVALKFISDKEVYLK